jgi:hypothetical protein
MLAAAALRDIVAPLRVGPAAVVGLLVLELVRLALQIQVAAAAQAAETPRLRVAQVVLVLSSSATPTHTQTPRRLLDRLHLLTQADIKFTRLPAAGA